MNDTIIKNYFGAFKVLGLEYNGEDLTFSFEKKDLKIDLANPPEIKETIDSKNGYLVIKIEK